jgi:hypothetical protein
MPALVRPATGARQQPLLKLKSRRSKRMTTITALLIEPDNQSITQVEMKVEPSDDPTCDNEVDSDELRALLNCHSFGAFAVRWPLEHRYPLCCYYQDDGDDAVMDKSVTWWQFDRSAEAMHGNALIMGFDQPRESYSGVDEAYEEHLRQNIVWSTRKLIDHETKITETDHETRFTLNRVFEYEPK